MGPGKDRILFDTTKINLIECEIGEENLHGEPISQLRDLIIQGRITYSLQTKSRAPANMI